MSSSSSSSSSSYNLQTSSIFRMSGTDLISGLDTDSIVKALTANTQSKIDKQQQLEQIAEWKRDLYRDVISDVKTFSNTYFSYTNSATNLLSSNFFKTTDITSSSSAVTATGDPTNAQNLTIESITQLAKQASYVSGHKVSDESITSGDLYDTWTQSAVGGKSLVVSYGGTDYTLTLSNSVKLDSENSTLTTDGDGNEVKTVDKSELQKIVDGLNTQVEANSSLNGKVEFSLTEDGDGKQHITLSAADEDETVSVKAYAADGTDTSGQDFLKALGLAGSAAGSSVTGSALDADVYTSSLFNRTVSSSSYLKFTLNGEEHTVKLGANVNLGQSGAAAGVAALASILQSQINADPELDGKIAVSSHDGQIKFTAADGNTIAVTGGSQNLLKGLGLPTGGAESSDVSGTGFDASALFQSYLGDTLAGSTLTFSLDGISKSVTFDAGKQSEYSSADGILSYLQGKLDSAFGPDRVEVAKTDDGQGLRFYTDDGTSVLSVTSSDTVNVLNQYGALRIGAGETNRAETSKTLDDLAGELNGTLEKGTDGKYTFSINGKSFSFDGNSTLGNVISQINADQDAGVTAVYSQTTDSFRFLADDSGSQGKIEFGDGEDGGTLASVLFGSYDADKCAEGQDLVMSVSLDGNSDPISIVRSSNSITLDGVNLQISGKTDTPVTFSTQNNVDDLATKIVDFINDYNKIIDKVNTLTSQMPDTDQKYAPLTDAQKEDMTDDEIEKWNTEAQKGLLQNDDALNNILRDLRSAMTSAVDAAGLSLSDLGITTQAYDYTSGGQLTVDVTTLKETLSSDPNGVAQLFTGTDGVASRVKSVLDKNVGTFGGDGVLLLRAGSDTNANDTSQLSLQIKNYEKTISDLKDQLQTQQDRYWDEFTQMEQTLSTLNSQLSYLTSMLGSGS